MNNETRGLVNKAVSHTRIVMLKNLNIWRRFQSEINENDLKRISEADYGYNANEHFFALKSILFSGKLPERLEWEPREVLGLVSWNEYWKEDVSSCEQAYFCSVVLLAASEQKLSNEHLDGQIEKMIIAIDTSKLLGQGRTKDLYEFFQYLLPKIMLQEVEEDFLYFNLSLFVMASMLNKSPDELDELISIVLRVERAVAEHCQYELNPDIFAYTFFDQRINIWRKYYEEFANLLEERRNNDLRVSGNHPWLQVAKVDHMLHCMDHVTT